MKEEQEQKNSYLITLCQRSKYKNYQRPYTIYCFNSIQKDLKPIYENFCLLSYFSRECGVKIKRRQILQEDKKAWECMEFTILNQQATFYLFLIQKEDYNSNGKGLTINYRIGSQKSVTNAKFHIEVTITPRKHNEWEEIEIRITDKDEWISKNIGEKEEMGLLSLNTRLSDMMKGRSKAKKGREREENKKDHLKSQKDESVKHIMLDEDENSHELESKFGDDELEYFYQEPEDVRNHENPNKHISLALQGGGVKGLAYIGAKMGLKRQGETYPITSIIGSSAGGILGLAICCEMPEEGIENLIKNDLAQITLQDKSTKFVNSKGVQVPGEQYYKDKLKILMDTLVQYGIIDIHFAQFLEQIILDEPVQNALLEFLNKFNPAICDLFKDSHDKFTLAPFFSAGLMTGFKMRQIGAKCISSLLQHKEFGAKAKKKKEQIEDKFGKNENEKEGEGWMYRLTLKDLYEITGKEFTCTSVDIDSQILRFFNHKTTPQLPACYAVQMTGSFPIAFKAQHWKQEWGRYYIHYDRIRRQVNITGHQFTDGGMLANFPVKYLDNEKMRPMYFSHKKTSNTVMFGFGLEVVVKPESLAEASSQLSEVIMGRIKCKICSYLPKAICCCCCNKSVTNTITETSNPMNTLRKYIPAIDFGLKLLDTYVNTKDNLTQECFSHSTYETCINDELRTLSLKQGGILEQVKRFNNFFSSKLIEKKLGGSTAQIWEQLKTNIKIILHQIKESPHTEYHLVQIEKLMNYMLTKIMYTYLGCKCGEKEKQNIKAAAFKLLKSMNQMNSSQIFVFSHVKRDFRVLEEILTEMDRLFDDLFKRDPTFKETLSVIRREEDQQVKSMYEILKAYEKKVAKSDVALDREEEINLMKLGKQCVTLDLKAFLEVIEYTKVCEIPQFQIHFEANFNREILRSYVNKMLKEGHQKNNNKISVVLESVPLSEIYFHEYMGFVNDAIHEFNYVCGLKGDKQMKINSMTASNFHSLITFLYASDLSDEQIHQEVWHIRKKLTLNPHLDEQFDSKMWTKSSELQMRELHEQVWKHKKEIFSLVERQIQTNKQDIDLKKTLLNKLDTLESEVENSADIIYESMKTSIDYVVNEVNSFDPDQSKDENFRRVIENLTINLKDSGYRNESRQKQNIMAYTESQQNAQKAGKLASILKEKFSQLFLYTLYSSPYINQFVSCNLPIEERKKVWKGLVICETLNIFEIKSYVCQILIRLGLSPYTTLKEFYSLSSKKINLNFTAISSPENIVKIFNHHTSPNLPLWAAVVATSSLPEFFKPLYEIREWRSKIESSYKNRETNAYFNKQSPKNVTLSSADIITKLPLDLLTNETLKKTLIESEEDRNEIYLCFNFSDFHLSSFNIVKSLISEDNAKKDHFQMTCQPIKISTLIKAKICKQFEAIGPILKLPMIGDRFKRLAIYINSHDNLIANIYKEELAALPIRLETLDFRKMVHSQDNGKTFTLSEIAQDSILQSKYVVKEKVDNSGKYGNKGKNSYIKIEKSNEKQSDLKIRFLAKLNPINSLMQSYRIFTTKSKKIGDESEYYEIKTEDLFFKFNDDKEDNYLCLKFDFPIEEKCLDQTKEVIKIKKTQCLKVNLKEFRNLKSNDKNYVYALPFNEFLNHQSKSLEEIELRSQESQDRKISFRPYVCASKKSMSNLFCNRCLGNNLINFKPPPGENLRCYMENLKRHKGSKSKNKNQKMQEEGQESEDENECKSSKKGAYSLVYKCASCPGNVMYCGACKYVPHLEGGNLKCPLNHLLEYYQKNSERFKDPQSMYFTSCDICMNPSIYAMLHDQDCKVDICDTCRILFMNQK